MPSVRTVTVKYTNGPAATMEATRAAAMSAVKAMALAWHERYLPAHFTVSGGKKYGYQPRSGDNEPPRIPNPGYSANRALGFSSPKTIVNPKYSWRKRRAKGHNRPLVYSGRSEMQAKAAIKVTTRRRQGFIQAIGAMYLPTYFYQYLKPGTYKRAGFRYDEYGKKHPAMIPYTLKHEQPHKFDELTRVTPDEVVALTALAEAETLRMLNASRETETVTVR